MVGGYNFGKMVGVVIKSGRGQNLGNWQGGKKSGRGSEKSGRGQNFGKSGREV